MFQISVFGMCVCLQAESPQESSPGVLSRIGSWLSWGWGSPASSGDDHTSQTQAPEEDHGETSAHGPSLAESDPAETSPTLERNAKHLRLSKKHKRSRSIERRRPPELFDQMGRRRSSRRRRSSGGGAKSPTNPRPESLEATSLTCADSASEELGKSLPEASGAEAPNSGNHEDVFQAEWAQAHLSEDSDSLVQAALVYTDMDEERVVRLTESSESKRRSIKVSHSEVVFAKKVVVTSEEQREDQNETFKDTKRPRSDERDR